MTGILARTSSGGTTAWYLTDKLGSVRDIVSTSGTVLDHIVYDSFGNIVSETNSANGDRFKFAEMQYDSTTSQYYDRARNYDSAIGRFDEVDPMGFGALDANLYRYVGNSPSDTVDPNGMDPNGGQQNPPGQQPNSLARRVAMASYNAMVKHFDEMSARALAEATALAAVIKQLNAQYEVLKPQLSVFGMGPDPFKGVFTLELAYETIPKLLANLKTYIATCTKYLGLEIALRCCGSQDER